MNAPVELHSRQSEQSVLGALLLDPAALDKVIDRLDAQAFYDAAHQAIYRMICMMSQRNQAIDAVTVSEALEAAGDAERTGGFAYIAELAANVPGAGAIRRYADVVDEKWQLRKMLSVSSAIAALATEVSNRTVAERMDEAEGLVMALTDRRAVMTKQPQPISATLGRLIEEIQARVDSGGAISGLPTGFADIDEKTCGMQKGDLIIVAARPSMGKSAFAMNIAENVAVEQGLPVAVFSLEMGDGQLTERSLSSIGGVNSQSIRSGRLTEGDWDRLAYAMGKLSPSKLILDDTGGLTAVQIRARARRIKKQVGLSLVIIDYLQLMTAPATTRADNRNEEVSGITRMLKAMAKELAVPVIALSQLSRKVEERADKRPMMSDLRESGAIEQDADVILMLYREEYYRPDTMMKGFAEVIIGKQRMGPTGMVPLLFQGEYSRFRNPVPGEYAQLANRQHSERQRRRHGAEDM
jgi:replicative DNA helicase